MASAGNRPDLAGAAHALLGVRLTERQLEALRWFAGELIDWNRRVNLTAVTDPAEIDIKHFLDSLTCLLAMGERPAGRVVDVGTGAGFPGLPLKIVSPQLRLTLVEATGRKLDFCRHVMEGLGLEGVELVHARAEDAGQQPEHRQAYDWALARAVAAMPVLVEYLLPLLRLGGQAVIQKGEAGPVEAQAAEKALRVLGGAIRQVRPVELPGVVEQRYLIVIEKVAATPAAYPRRSGVPTKRPLT